MQDFHSGFTFFMGSMLIMLTDVNLCNNLALKNHNNDSDLRVSKADKQCWVCAFTWSNYVFVLICVFKQYSRERSDISHSNKMWGSGWKKSSHSYWHYHLLQEVMTSGCSERVHQKTTRTASLYHTHIHTEHTSLSGSSLVVEYQHYYVESKWAHRHRRQSTANIWPGMDFHALVYTYMSRIYLIVVSFRLSACCGDMVVI